MRVVPDVVGESQFDAYSQLTSAGFMVSYTYEYSATVNAGRIISQDPAAGTTLLSGSVVGVVIS